MSEEKYYNLEEYINIRKHNMLEKYTGMVRTYYDLDYKNINEEYFLIMGKKEGEYKSVYKNGNIAEKSIYVNDKKHG